MRKLLILLLSIFLFSCEDYSYKGNPHLIVNVSDAPSLKFTSLSTSINSVEIFNGTNWWTLDSSPVMFDVMSLTGREYLTIVDEDIPEGNYSKIRVIFNDDNYITVYDDAISRKMVSDSLSLIWESDLLFNAKSDDIAVAEIDIDLNKSVKYDSVYRFVPCEGCRILDAEACGAVSAMMIDEDNNVINTIIQVKVSHEDSLVCSTYSNSSTGKVFVRLPGGIYNIDFCCQADSVYAPLKCENVIVENGKVSSLDDIYFEKIN